VVEEAARRDVAEQLVERIRHKRLRSFERRNAENDPGDLHPVAVVERVRGERRADPLQDLLLALARSACGDPGVEAEVSGSDFR